MSATKRKQAKELAGPRAVARALCRASAVNTSCVMDTDPDREPCTFENCRMMRIARTAIREAIATGPLPVAK